MAVFGSYLHTAAFCPWFRCMPGNYSYPGATGQGRYRTGGSPGAIGPRVKVLGRLLMALYKIAFLLAARLL